MLEIVDKTKLFGRNATRVSTDGREQEVLTRGRKKPFMLSARTDVGGAALTCRLVSRGPGWFTRQERFLSSDEVDADGRPLLIERHVLTAPGRDDVVVHRRFERASDEDLGGDGARRRHDDGQGALPSPSISSSSSSNATADTLPSGKVASTTLHPLVGALLADDLPSSRPPSSRPPSSSRPE